jgi:hypothetical protein
MVALCVWFTLVVPAHQRGQIRLPGADLVQSSCCHAKTARTCDTPTPAGERGEPGDRDDPVRDCAVCHLVAKLTTPEPLVFTLPDPELLAEGVVLRPEGRQLDVPLDARRTRGPPGIL